MALLYSMDQSSLYAFRVITTFLSEISFYFFSEAIQMWKRKLECLIKKIISWDLTAECVLLVMNDQKRNHFVFQDSACFSGLSLGNTFFTFANWEDRHLESLQEENIGVPNNIFTENCIVKSITSRILFCSLWFLIYFTRGIKKENFCICLHGKWRIAWKKQILVKKCFELRNVWYLWWED